MKNHPIMTVYPVVVCCLRDSKNGHEGMILGVFTKNDRPRKMIIDRSKHTEVNTKRPPGLGAP